jgi:predicted O-linked N-acetylglucosamine transferase (SPINDLY family)
VHSAGNRLIAFAHKPAPVQVTWLGYPGTTGLRTIDYRFTDPYLDPPNSNDSHYSERSIRLPHTFWCYDPSTVEVSANNLPALTNGFVTFGCLNNPCKINDFTLSLWAQVLEAVPDSRFLLLGPRGSWRQRALQTLRVGADRVEFVDRQPRMKYLELYHRIDIGLDTFPYNGHTTSIDGLCMGVPTVSLAGQTAVSRAGFSQTSNLGLASELVATDAAQFTRLAVELAGSLPRVRELRATLRQQMQDSPLMNPKAMAQSLEAAYRELWQRWCDDVAPS